MILGFEIYFVFSLLMIMEKVLLNMTVNARHHTPEIILFCFGLLMIIKWCLQCARGGICRSLSIFLFFALWKLLKRILTMPACAAYVGVYD